MCNLRAIRWYRPASRLHSCVPASLMLTSAPTWCVTPVACTVDWILLKMITAWRRGHHHLRGIDAVEHTMVVLRLNQQQLELLDKTLASGAAPDRESLVRRALREYAANHAGAAAEGAAVDATRPPAADREAKP